ncbi:hypothetical protein B0H19DRAFT_1065860 [Mycena capillaripes]|nr:hypothetical protein B0H19DRAFT_1065860 [Mycena capillaripes]
MSGNRLSPSPRNCQDCQSQTLRAAVSPGCHRCWHHSQTWAQNNGAAVSLVRLVVDEERRTWWWWFESKIVGDCGAVGPHISSVGVMSSRQVRKPPICVVEGVLNFKVDANESLNSLPGCVKFAVFDNPSAPTLAISIPQRNRKKEKKRIVDEAENEMTTLACSSTEDGWPACTSAAPQKDWLGPGPGVISALLKEGMNAEGGEGERGRPARDVGDGAEGIQNAAVPYEGYARCLSSSRTCFSLQGMTPARKAPTASAETLLEKGLREFARRNEPPPKQHADHRQQPCHAGSSQISEQVPLSEKLIPGGLGSSGQAGLFKSGAIMTPERP